MNMGQLNVNPETGEVEEDMTHPHILITLGQGRKRETKDTARLFQTL